MATESKPQVVTDREKSPFIRSRLFAGLIIISLLATGALAIVAPTPMCRLVVVSTEAVVWPYLWVAYFKNSS